MSDEKSPEEIEQQKAKLRAALNGVLPTVTRDEIDSHIVKSDEQFLADRPPHHDQT